MALEELIIPATPGLLVAGFAFEIYNNGIAQSTAALGVTELVVDVTASNYVVTGRVEPASGDHWSLTWNDGVRRSVRRYPIQTAQPSNFIISLRQDSVVIGDLDMRLYLDGVDVGLGGLALTNLGTPFDYRIATLPVPVSGSTYTLSFNFGGQYFVESWSTPVVAVAAVASPSITVDSLINHLTDCMSDTISAQLGTIDGFGKFTASGTPVTIQCYIKGESMLIRDPTGQEVISSFQIVTAGPFNLNAESYRYTLPTSFTPKTDLKAIAIRKVVDEDGPHHEVIMLP